jgi:L-lactate dehydrogenase complex protein LldE
VRVALFITCLNDTFFPRVGVAVVRVLRHFGCQVRFPEDQTCCGQPAYNSGLHDDARPVARRLLHVFSGDGYVVSPSASCVAMIRRHVPELLADDPREHAEALRLADRTHEFGVFLRDVLRVDVGAILRLQEPCTYHYPCHARGVYDVDELERQLASPAADVHAPRYRDMCCGFGGTFAVDYAAISGDMLADRLNDLESTGAKLVVCNEGGCALNLAGGAHRRGSPLRFRHVAELLAESLGLMEPMR